MIKKYDGVMMIKDGEKVIKKQTKYLSVLCKKRFDQFPFQVCKIGGDRRRHVVEFNHSRLSPFPLP